MPWTATITYRRGGEAWREVVCADCGKSRRGAACGQAGFLSGLYI
jgi:hypothetical protein